MQTSSFYKSSQLYSSYLHGIHSIATKDIIFSSAGVGKVWLKGESVLDRCSLKNNIQSIPDSSPLTYLTFWSFFPDYESKSQYVPNHT